MILSRGGAGASERRGCNRRQRRADRIQGTHQALDIGCQRLGFDRDHLRPLRRHIA